MIKSLSIVLPLYNEEKRLKKTFEEVKKFSNKNKIKKEYIFVDDGSLDNSNLMIKNFFKKKKIKNSKLKLIKSKINLGKGNALKLGVKAASYDWILTTDIDFSVSLFEIEKWVNKKYIDDKKSVYFGSRSHEHSVVISKFYRKLIGIFLRILISSLLGINLRDTQCGFKLYKKNLAKRLFSQIKFLGYEHDIEIVVILAKKKIYISELPVSWKHVSDSKVNIITDSIKIFFKIIQIKITYFLRN